MGIINHNAIIVTSWHDKSIEAAKEKIIEIWDLYEDYHPVILDSGVNVYKTIFIPPDGSKEGWAESDDGDEKRKKFTDWIESNNNEESGIYLEVVEVSYGEYGSKIEYTNCKNRYE